MLSVEIVVVWLALTEVSALLFCGAVLLVIITLFAIAVFLQDLFINTMHDSPWLTFTGYVFFGNLLVRGCLLIP